MSIATAASGGLTPLWPYVVGGLAAAATTMIGVWRLIGAWRAGIEDEAEKKTLNTQALKANTDAAERNSRAISTLTTRLDQWESRWERFAEKTDGRLAVLEKKTPARRRGGSAGGREPP